MHLSLAGSALLMLLLLFALGSVAGVQPGQITRDVDNGQLTDNRRNLQSRWKQMTLSKSLDKRWQQMCIRTGDTWWYCDRCVARNCNR
uniref:Conotoxin n=1 Tax=Conus betulinus TaxID=89764 RepID=A0A142C1P3_CONBE|nr:conotoxin [Conus betulinus]